jgi:hypothetical protein
VLDGRAAVCDPHCPYFLRRRRDDH